MEGGATSQESVAYFLKRQPRGVCVVNSGIHDMTLKQMPDLTYQTNVQFWLDALIQSQGCGRLVWLQTSSVRGPNEKGQDQHGNPYRYPQTNAKIRVWNKLVADLLAGGD